MSGIDLSALLVLVQTIAIVAALFLAVYISRKQLEALTKDLEARVLNDLNMQLHGIGEIAIQKPELISVIAQGPNGPSADVPFTYYILFFFAHIFHMRQRGILADNEWAGWQQWMRNAFQSGTIGTRWKEGWMATWFDPAFRSFVEQELIPAVPAAAAGSPAAAPP
ncbi:MAG TPA: hypothetical protein VFF67_08615 [Thermoplasmata archaeon]|nr:hypothetical protein [Thermoplasmata archaeon]